jgi:endoplasmic reticulum lectin 1
MEEDKKEKIPTWHFNGFDYPYHKVEMTGGTPCDLRGNNPRSVSILYICQTDAQTYGMLLLVEESTACHYVAMVGSKQLCQNTGFRYMLYITVFTFSFSQNVILTPLAS